MQKLILFFIFILMQTVQADASVFLDWESAWQLVCCYAPSIAVSDAAVAAREADIRQVSLLPNPIGVIESENIGIRNHDDDAEPPETTFALSQLIELGGKRSARRGLAVSLTDLAYLDSQIERENLRFELTSTFIDVSVAQERLNLAQARERLAAQTVETINTLVEGGKVSPIQSKKAQVALMGTQIALREAYSELNQSKKKLSSMWGCANPDFDGVVYTLFNCFKPPCQCRAIEGIFQTPDFVKAQQMVYSSSKNLQLQKANSIPNVTLTLGYSVFTDSGQGGWLVGAEMPLPFFDRNQGNICRARIEINQAEYQLDEIVREMAERIILIHERLLAAFEESEMIKCEVLKEATETYQLVQQGYENGKLEYLDLLDAEKTLFEIQEHYLGILHDYHQNLAELARLTRS